MKLFLDLRRLLGRLWPCSGCLLSFTCFSRSRWAVTLLLTAGGAIPARRYITNHATQKKKILIVPDESKKKRELDKQLRSEMRDRQLKGENNLMIQRGKIVKRVKSVQQDDVLWM